MRVPFKSFQIPYFCSSNKNVISSKVKAFRGDNTNISLGRINRKLKEQRFHTTATFTTPNLLDVGNWTIQKLIGIMNIINKQFAKYVNLADGFEKLEYGNWHYVVQYFIFWKNIPVVSHLPIPPNTMQIVVSRIPFEKAIRPSSNILMQKMASLKEDFPFTSFRNLQVSSIYSYSISHLPTNSEYCLSKVTC